MTLPGTVDEVEHGPVVVACLGGGTVDEVAPLLDAVDVIRRSKVTIASFALSISSCDSNTWSSMAVGDLPRNVVARSRDVQEMAERIATPVLLKSNGFLQIDFAKSFMENRFPQLDIGNSISNNRFQPIRLCFARVLGFVANGVP